MKDICFTELRTQQVSPSIKGKTYSTGQLIYQKILLLMLSDKSGLYRENSGTSLIRLIHGVNTPNDALLQTLGTTACNDAYSLLSAQDISHIDSLRASASNGQLSITLKLKDGQTYTGVLAG